MKIEIKPFNDRVRFAPSIAFKRLKIRTNATMVGSFFFGHHARQKKLVRATLLN
jgi:hypothetical protein